MYCDFQVYSPIMAPQIMARPSLVSSGQLFQVISVALGRNLNDYLQKKIQKQAQNRQIQPSAHRKAKTNETIVIDLQSEIELNEQVGTQEKDVQSNNFKFSTVPETVLETSHKESLMGVEENDSISQTLPKPLNEKLTGQKESIEEKPLRLICLEKSKNEENFPQFSVQCPKLGISNAQLLQKKQKLMARKVADWTDVDYKGPKQRREIRMLKN